MSTWLWIIFVVAVVIVAVLILSATIQRRRTERLREGFGPEYDRTVERAGARSRRGRAARRQQPPRRAGAPPARAAGPQGLHGRLAGHAGRVRRRSCRRDLRRRPPHPERDARPRLSRRGLRGPRGARLRRPSAGRRALSPRARHRRRERRRQHRHRGPAASPCRTTARCFVELVERDTVDAPYERVRGTSRVWPDVPCAGAPASAPRRCQLAALHELATSPPKPAGRAPTPPSGVSEPFLPILNALIWPVLPPFTYRKRSRETLSSSGWVPAASCAVAPPGVTRRELALPVLRVGGDRVRRRVGGEGEAAVAGRGRPAGGALAVQQRRRDRRERIELVGA